MSDVQPTQHSAEPVTPEGVAVPDLGPVTAVGLSAPLALPTARNPLLIAGVLVGCIAIISGLTLVAVAMMI